MTAKTVMDPSQPMGAFAGRVLSGSTGEGVANAELSFARVGMLQSVRTTTEGQFVFVPPALGAYTLAVVTAADFLPYAPELGQSAVSLEARAGQRINDITIYMTEAVDFTGRVDDPDGQPVAGAAVKMFCASCGSLALMALPGRFTSDSRGEFHFHAPDDMLFSAYKTGFGEGRARFERASMHADPFVIKLAAAAPLQALLTITGRVVNAAGEGAAAVAVTAQPMDNRYLATRPVTSSGDDGAFTLVEVDPGKYQVSAVPTELAPAHVDNVAAGAAGVVLTVAVGGEVRGQITSAGTREPLPSASVALIAHDGPFRETTVKTVSVFDAQGRYRMRGISAGDYGVIASAYGYAPSAEQHVTVTAAAVTADLALHKGGSLSGVVRDKRSRQPVAGAHVSFTASLPGGSTPMPFTAGAISDTNGHFFLSGLPTGRQSLDVTASGYDRRMVAGFEVVDEVALPDTAIDLVTTAAGEAPKTTVSGIGCMLSANQDAIVVAGVIAGSGAEGAGLQIGDTILQVEGTPVKDLGMNGTIQAIRGTEYTSVQLTILQKSTGATLTLSAQRIPVSF